LRTLTFLTVLLFTSINGAQAAIIATFEGPTDGQTVSGVGLIRGWAFSDQPNVKIAQVTLNIDDKSIGSIPCCSERPDVREAFPQHSSDNTLNSGFGIIRNYGTHTNGPHTFTITIQDSNGEKRILTHTVTTVKIGSSEFLDQFSISSAQVELEGQDLLLSNVQVRDKETQQLRQVATRLRWVSGVQGLSIVDATAPAGIVPATIHASQISEQIEQTLVSNLQAVLESPNRGSAASGISVIRGWAFPPSGRTIQSVQLFVDGNFFQSIPCCSNRQDVADAFPGEPNAKNSGYGVTFNYGRLTPGEHTIGVSIQDSSDVPALLLQSQITVVAPAGFEFLDEFDLSTADLRIDGDDLVIRGVKIRNKASHQTSFRILRFRWDIASQNFNLVHDNGDPEQLISDDFEDGEAGDWTIVSGQWNVSNGEFINTSDDPFPKGIAVSGPEVTDFQLTAQLRSTDNDAIGLVFGVHSEEDYYLVKFTTQKNVQLQKRTGSAVSTLATTSPFSFTKGVAFEAAVRVQEKRIRVFVNGRTVIDFTDPTLTSGKVGLYSQFNKFAAFDDVHLATLNTVKIEGGNTIHVDAANAGKPQDGQTEATAWSTINQALNDSRFRETAGNTILIKSGLYREQVDILGRMSGIPGAFNTIRAVEGADVIVDGEKVRREGVLIHTGVSYVRVEGLHIQNAQHRGILVFESGPGELVGNRIHSCSDSGIEFWYGVRNYETVNNVIYHNEQDGIVISEGSGDDPSRLGANRAIMIRNNLIYANGPDGGDGIAVRNERAHSFALYNNTIVGNTGDGISIDPANCWGDIRNNIIVDSGRIGLKMVPDDSVSRAYNNLFSNGAGGLNNFDGRGGQGQNSIAVDPLFINAFAGDFRLQAGSPSLNTGDPAVQFNDTDSTRNDMGVYGGPSPLSGVPPLN
jgi:hypothetical protein